MASLAGRALLLGFVFLTALFPARAGSTLEPPDLERYLRWGPVRARPGLDISDVGYDSNIFYATGNREPISDITAKISPKLDGLVLFGDRAFLTFLGKLDFGLYLQNSSLNFIDKHGKSRITLPSRSKRFGLFTDLNISSVNERPVDFEDIRPIRDRRLFGIGFIVEAGWRSSIEVRQSLTKIEYQDTDFSGQGQFIGDRLDREEDTTRATLRYRVFGRTRALVEGAWGEIDFRVPLEIDGATTNRDRNEWSLLSGLSFGEGGRLSGFFKVGWAEINALDPVLPDLSELVGEAKLALRIGDQTRLRLDGRRLPGFSIWGASSYYLLTETGTRVVHYLNRPLGVEAGVSVGRLTFPGSLSTVDRVDDLLHYDVGVRLRMFENSMGRRVEYSIRLGRYRRQSSLPQYDISRNTFGFNAILGY